MGGCYRAAAVIRICAAVKWGGRASRRRLRQLGSGNTGRVVRGRTGSYGLGELRASQAHREALFSAMVLHLRRGDDTSAGDCLRWSGIRRVGIRSCHPRHVGRAVRSDHISERGCGGLRGSTRGRERVGWGKRGGIWGWRVLLKKKNKI